MSADSQADHQLALAYGCRARSPAACSSQPVVFGFAQSNGSDAPNLAGTGLGGPGRHLDCPLSAKLRCRRGAVRASLPSGSERLRLPPQIGPQPTHPVRQNIACNPEVNIWIHSRPPASAAVRMLLSAGRKWAMQGLTPVWQEHQACAWNSLRTSGSPTSLPWLLACWPAAARDAENV